MQINRYDFNGKRFVPFRRELRNPPYEHTGILDTETNMSSGPQGRSFAKTKEHAQRMNEALPTLEWTHDEFPASYLEFNGVKAEIITTEGGYSAEVTLPDGTTFTKSSVDNHDLIYHWTESIVLHYGTGGDNA